MLVGTIWCHGRCCESMLYGCAHVASGPDCHVTWALDIFQSERHSSVACGSSSVQTATFCETFLLTKSGLSFVSRAFASVGNASSRLFVG